MKLSAPIHHLKRRARTLSRGEGIPLNQALNRIARQEGFQQLEPACSTCGRSHALQ